MFDLHEGRQVQNKAKTSAADALFIKGDSVPDGKIWTIIAAALYPSVAETRVVLFERNAKDFGPYPITIPFSASLDTTIRYPMLTEGNEYLLLPGESITGRRIAATAGSTITLYFEFVESDLPYYSYIEPVRKLVSKRSSRILQAATGTGAAFSSPVIGPRGGDRRGESGSEPI